MSLPPTPEKSLCFLMQNARGLHLFKCHSGQPRRNRYVFSWKMRVAFILTVNLNATGDQRPPTRVFFNEKCALYQPPQIPCVFSGKLRLAFTVPLNSNDTRPTAPGFRIFFKGKRTSRRPRRNRCVFLMCNAPRLHFDCKNKLPIPPTPEKSLCFLMWNAPGLHLDCKFAAHSRQPRRKSLCFLM